MEFLVAAVATVVVMAVIRKHKNGQRMQQKGKEGRKITDEEIVTVILPTINNDSK